jgi:DUF1365 family protein
MANVVRKLESCLYRCEVMHQRLAPRKNDFRYNIFMFYLDLDELDVIHQDLKLFSYNKANWFSFKDRDHVQPSDEKQSRTTKANILKYVSGKDITLGVDSKIKLLTNVTTLGYVFNPISIYVCFNAADEPVCAVAEVSNTHHEMKLYLLDQTCFDQGVFRLKIAKYFYVSPFVDLDTEFDFIFKIPEENLNMRVDDYQHGQRFLLTALTGTKRKLTNTQLLWYGLRFPFITLEIITLIHWQAFVLYLKGLPFMKRNINLHLQRDLSKQNPI